MSLHVCRCPPYVNLTNEIYLNIASCDVCLRQADIISFVIHLHRHLRLLLSPSKSLPPSPRCHPESLVEVGFFDHGSDFCAGATDPNLVSCIDGSELRYLGD